ncbi:MAG: hypothetical protein QXJ97_02425 [Desulfurococcaceae archaeon]
MVERRSCCKRCYRTLVCPRQLKGSKGSITVSTVIFISIFILIMFLSFSILNRYIRNYYSAGSAPLESIISVHDAIINSCCSGYGGARALVFLPPGSYMHLQENYVSVIGIDLKSLSEEYIETVLKSRTKCDFLEIEVKIKKNTLILKYFVSITSERKYITFVPLVVPPGSHVISLYCKAFCTIEAAITTRS